MKKKTKVLLFTAGIIGMAVSVLMGIKYNYNNDYIKSSDSNVIIELGEEERGPESFAFDAAGKGPYATISDGRVIKWEHNQTTWLHFASSSTHTHRRERCEGRDIKDGYEREVIYGRPLGLCFNKSNNHLYIADAYFGLLLVGPNGGPPTTIAKDAEGMPFMFTNGLDIDHSNDVVFFTDSSSRYQRRNYIYVILSGDKSGRLMKYDPKTKKVTILLRNLSFPNGVALSEDGSFILVAETSNCRILKYWIETSKVEVFAELPGFPDNIKTSPRGGYWVGVNSKRDKFAECVLSYPWIGNALIKLVPFDLMRVYSIVSMYRGSGMGIRLDENGKILEVFEDRNRFKSISEIMEKDGHLWIGSINFPFAGRYQVTT
ncbi:protein STRICTOSIDINE SYNTHASE-LIKE 2-like [Euphorbia lathyris]|uniref:protein STRICTOSIDINE SYNTHASE-LIKE 2-like n=1 Tax=Euphorbia lathyris TaxID=212925 RepID=UPI003313894F